MAKTYADDTKKIVELYAKGKDPFGREVDYKLGFQKVFYCDDVTGAILVGPFIEPCPDTPRGAGHSVPYNTSIIGREYLLDSMVNNGTGSYFSVAV